MTGGVLAFLEEADNVPWTPCLHWAALGGTLLGGAGEDDQPMPDASRSQQSDDAVPEAPAISSQDVAAILLLDEIITKLASFETEDAVSIRKAAQTMKEGKQAEIRKLCTPFGVQGRERKPSGKWGNRTNKDIISDLATVLAQRASKELESGAQHIEQPAPAQL